MSIRDAVEELKKKGFDPKEGKEFNAYQKIPDGTYIMSLDTASHSVKGDRDFLVLGFTVATGEQEGRQENIYPSLAQTKSNGQPMPASVLARNISMIQVIGEMVNNPIPDKCFDFDSESDAYEALEKAFQPALGKVLEMTITSAPNKKNPQYPFRNYEFAKHEQPEVAKAKDPFDGKGDTTDINDDDLPF